MALASNRKFVWNLLKYFESFIDNVRRDRYGSYVVEAILPGGAYGDGEEADFLSWRVRQRRAGGRITFAPLPILYEEWRVLATGDEDGRVIVDASGPLPVVAERRLSLEPTEDVLLHAFGKYGWKRPRDLDPVVRVERDMPGELVMLRSGPETAIKVAWGRDQLPGRLARALSHASGPIERAEAERLAAYLSEFSVRRTDGPDQAYPIPGEWPSMQPLQGLEAFVRRSHWMSISTDVRTLSGREAMVSTVIGLCEPG